jgi:ATP synthase in type III secretion protein N
LSLTFSAERHLDEINSRDLIRLNGKVREVIGVVIESLGPAMSIGETCMVAYRRNTQPVLCEVVGFRDSKVLMMPLGDLGGIGAGSEVVALGRPLEIVLSDAVLGRIINGIGQPMDGNGPLVGVKTEVTNVPPDPLRRQRVDKSLGMGIRAIDSLLTVGKGQRVGIFSGSGVGKSTVLGMIARNTSADVNVIALVGERGREVVDFLEESLGEAGRARSVVVCATSDAPSLVRLKSAFVATAIAEYFREQGRRVLFMLDSVTRVARAQREVGLAAGEPPARQGYPPSVFALLPRLLERTGNDARGSITALYTVLVAGGDMEEPIADEVRGILDGHVILSREIAARNQWPAVDVLPSLSRLMSAVADPAHRAAAARLRELMAAYERQRDLILLGAYQRGADALTDEAVAKMETITAFLRQRTDEAAPFAETRARLLQLVS